MEVSIDFRGSTVTFIELDGIDTTDYPDFCDVYISEAWYEDGTPLTESELEQLENEYPYLARELVDEYLY